MRLIRVERDPNCPQVVIMTLERPGFWPWGGTKDRQYTHSAQGVASVYVKWRRADTCSSVGILVNAELEVIFGAWRKENEVNK